MKKKTIWWCLPPTPPTPPKPGKNARFKKVCDMEMKWYDDHHMTKMTEQNITFEILTCIADLRTIPFILFFRSSEQIVCLTHISMASHPPFLALLCEAVPLGESFKGFRLQIAEHNLWGNDKIRSLSIPFSSFAWAGQCFMHQKRDVLRLFKHQWKMHC